MKKDIHPEWFPEANVICACGNSWVTGATIPEIRTDICSSCHPFYTGEQRIVDTEGQVDRFYKRLQVRDNMRAEEEARKAAQTPPDLPLAELDLNKRYLNILEEHNMVIVQDFMDKLSEENGEASLLDIPGIGRKVLADLKRMLRARGYEIPEPQPSEEAAEATPEAE